MSLPQRAVARLTKSTSTAIRPSTLAATQSCASSRPTRQISSTSVRELSASQPRQAGDSHDSHYDPPTGWLWGQQPGTKYEKEGWETLWYWGFYGSLIAATVAYAWKPDTSIENWALEEAKRRLQAEGTLPEDE